MNTHAHTPTLLRRWSYCTCSCSAHLSPSRAEDAHATGYASRALPALSYSRHLTRATAPRFHMTSGDYTRVFMDSPFGGGPAAR
jgi:hypothetical protein